MDGALRLFFALWPDPRQRAALAAAAAALHGTCGGRVPPAANLHLTLAFLGPVPASRLAPLIELAAGIRAEPFTLQLDCCGCWPRQRLAWAGMRRAPPQLAALAAALACSLREAGYRSERRPFRPHVTLLRDTAGACPQTLPGPPPPWRVRQFVLAVSEPAAGGVRYRLLWRSTSVGGGLRR